MIIIIINMEVSMSCCKSRLSIALLFASQAALAAEMEGLPVMDMRAGGRRIDCHATDRVLHFNGGRAAAVWVIVLVMTMHFVRAGVRCLAGTAGRACRRGRVC